MVLWMCRNFSFLDYLASTTAPTPSRSPSQGHRLGFPAWAEFQGPLKEQVRERASLPAHLHAAPHPPSLHTAENLELLSRPQQPGGGLHPTSTKLLPGLYLAHWEEKPGADQPQRKCGPAHTLARRAWGPGYILGDGGEQAQPAADRSSATRIKLTFLLSKFISKLFAGEEYSRASKKKSTATGPKSVYQRSNHTCLPTSSGGLGLPSNCKDRPPPAPSRGDILQLPAHSLRRDSGGGRSPMQT